MIVDVEAERSIQIIFDELAQSRFTVNISFGCADNVVAIRKESSLIGGRVGDHVENMPDVLGD